MGSALLPIAKGGEKVKTNMAYSSNTGLDLPMEAENAMAEAYVVVELGTGANQVDLPANTAVRPFGVTQATAVAGQAVPVRASGVTKVVAHTSFSKGALLGIGATTGRVSAVAPVDATWSGASVKTIGVALEASGGAGEIVAMLIRPLEYGT